MRNNLIHIKTADFGVWLYDLSQVDFNDIKFKSGLLEARILYQVRPCYVL